MLVQVRRSRTRCRAQRDRRRLQLPGCRAKRGSGARSLAGIVSRAASCSAARRSGDAPRPSGFIASCSARWQQGVGEGIAAIARNDHTDPRDSSR